MKRWGILGLSLLLLASSITVFATEGYGLRVKSDVKNQAGKYPLMVRAKSLDDIKDVLRQSNLFIGYGSDAAPKDINVNLSTAPGSQADGSAPENAPPASLIPEVMQEKESHSTTNVQVTGIDEADVLKTDGKHIYIAGGQRVVIVDADGGTMKKAAEIPLQDGYSINDLFIDSGRLILLGTYYEPAPDTNVPYAGGAGDYAASDILWRPQKSFAYAAVYDTTQIHSPEQLQEFMLEGSLRSARKNGSYVYLAVEKGVYLTVPLEEADEKDLLPAYYDSREAPKESKTTGRSGEVQKEKGEKGEAMNVLSPSQVQLCPAQDECNFTTLASLDIRTCSPVEKESFLGSMQDFYMNDQSLYLAFYRYDAAKWQEQTGIIALDVSQKELTYRASAVVDGYLLNQFSMDEYRDSFRLATTNWDRGSSLYVMDRSLNVTGKIENIAEGEQIYSVRFAGDQGYIVTFETVDPFFTLDLSDPANPRIAGELKLPGFSNYLHPVSENKVLGIGRDTQEMFVRDADGHERVVGVRTGGIKMTLFDVKDFNHPKELDTMVIGDESHFAEVLENHKALYVREEEGGAMLGFCVESWSQAGDAQRGARLFLITHNRIVSAGQIPAIVENEKANVHLQADGFRHISRLCSIGNTLYYLDQGILRAFALEGLTELNALNL